MQTFVKHIVEPEHLLLVWQAPDHMKNRRRWVVGRVDVRSTPWSMRYLIGSEFEAANQGATFEEVASLGYEGYPAFFRKGEKVSFDAGVHEAFMRRLPPRNRPDFLTYLQRFGFADALGLSDAALLAYTEGKLPSDGFSLVGELRSEILIGDLMLDLAGTRYQDFGDECPAKPGSELKLRREPDNAFDPNAIQVMWGDQRIGYVNRTQAPAVGFWMDHRKITAILHRINGRAGNPKVYVLLRVRPDNHQLAA